MLAKLVPQYSLFQEVDQQLNDFKQSVGILEHEEALDVLSCQATPKVINSGHVNDVISAFVVFDYFKAPCPSNLTILSDVQIGKISFDRLLVQLHQRHGQIFAHVVCSIELVHDPNLIGKRFSQRQQQLKWLKGNHSGVENLFKCSVFPEGVFTSSQTLHDSMEINFTSESFSTSFSFHSVHQCYLHDIYFFTPNSEILSLDNDLVEYLKNRLCGDVYINNQESITHLMTDLEKKRSKAPSSQDVLQMKLDCAPNEIIIVEALIKQNVSHEN
ncbi:hypothetical protein GEMRC1_002797 [Eukaryota sp. GEM-RC1]